MAYALNPNVPRLTREIIPSAPADDVIMTHPQPSSLNYCCRPNTEVYGTAPYMAGKGAPCHLVDVADELRPQATTRFDKPFVNTVARGTFPWQDMKCSVPLRTMSFEPESTRAQTQNGLFQKRYC